MRNSFRRAASVRSSSLSYTTMMTAEPRKPSAARAWRCVDRKCQPALQFVHTLPRAIPLSPCGSDCEGVTRGGRGEQGSVQIRHQMSAGRLTDALCFQREFHGGRGTAIEHLEPVAGKGFMAMESGRVSQIEANATVAGVGFTRRRILKVRPCRWPACAHELAVLRTTFSIVESPSRSPTAFAIEARAALRWNSAPSGRSRWPERCPQKRVTGQRREQREERSAGRIGVPQAHENAE